MLSALDKNHSSAQSLGGIQAWLVCLSAGLFFFYEFFQMNLFDVINEPLRVDFHISATQLSWMCSAYLWANVLFMLPAGSILDRFSIRWVLACAMMLCVFGTAGFAFTHSYKLATLFHAFTGVGNAFSFLSCIMLVSRWFPERKHAFLMGCLITLAFVGGMMAHGPLAHLHEYMGWRQALWIDAIVGLFILVILVLFIRDNPHGDRRVQSLSNTAVAKEAKSSHFSEKKVFTNAQNWWAGLYTSTLNLPIIVLGALWGASHVSVVYQIPMLQASNIVSFIFLGMIFGCPIIGRVSDYLRNRKQLMIGGAILTIFVFLPLCMSWSLSPLSLSIIFFAVGFFSSTQILSYPLIAMSNKPEHTGIATAIASVLIMGGGALAQLLFAGLLQMHAGAVKQSYVANDYYFALWLFPIMMVVALIAALRVKEQI